MTGARSTLRTTAIDAFSALTAVTAASAQERTPSAEGTRVFIIAPVDGAAVASPVTGYFGLDGMGVAPAGVEWDHTGHDHLMIDVAELPAFDAPLTADENHRHFSGGQTQLTLELERGEDTLQLLLADWQHVPHDPPLLSEPITITVE